MHMAIQPLNNYSGYDIFCVSVCTSIYIQTYNNITK